jgi:hypothetical protein
MTAPRYCPHVHGLPELPSWAPSELPGSSGCTEACGAPLHGREVLRGHGLLGGVRLLRGPRGRLLLGVIVLLVGGTGVRRGQ